MIWKASVRLRDFSSPHEPELRHNQIHILDSLHYRSPACTKLLTEIFGPHSIYVDYPPELTITPGRPISRILCTQVIPAPMVIYLGFRSH